MFDKSAMFGRVAKKFLSHYIEVGVAKKYYRLIKIVYTRSHHVCFMTKNTFY